MSQVMPVPILVNLPVAKMSERFPVRRVYGVHRNYEYQCDETLFRGSRTPSLYCKPADILRPVETGSLGHVPFPGLGQTLYLEVGLVVAIGKGGRGICAKDAAEHIYGFAVGLDLMGSDPQASRSSPWRRWTFGGTFDTPTYIGSIVQAADAEGHSRAQLWLQVNGRDQQRSTTGNMLWSVAQIIEYLSEDIELHPGDLICTGTPDGMGLVAAGDQITAEVDSVGSVVLQVAGGAET